MQWVKKRLLVFVSIFFLCGLLGTAAALIGAPVANAQTNNSNTNTTDTGVTCAIEKVGWILCPVVETGAKISDSMFQIIANNFLRTDPQLVSNNNQGTRYAWDLARNLANIMFIIAFLIVIFSQVTGQGISNYGIKRMLPRLIIAAILVNLSYIICQAAVDLSNILGYEIKNALSDAANNVGPSIFSEASQYSSFERTTTSSLSAGVLWTLAMAILAAGSWPFLGPILATIPLVLATLLTIVVILMLRKALIVLLVVISPIAFVLYLLPNTEKLFNRWAKMFVQLLMVFPVVGLLFGAGQLASTIILVSSPPVSANQNCDTNTNTASTQQTNAKKDPNSPVSFGICEGSISINDPQAKKSGAATWTTGLIATGVAVAPLLAVWSVLKGALSAAGAIGGKVSGAVGKVNSAVIGGGGKKLGEKYGASTIGQMRARSRKIREAQIRAGQFKGRGGKANPRNWRSATNRYLNEKVPWTGYRDQRRRMRAKDDTAYIRDKAQDMIAAGTYDEDIVGAIAKLNDQSLSPADRDDANNTLQAAVMAKGSQEGRAGLEEAYGLIVNGFRGIDGKFIAGLPNSKDASSVVRQAHLSVARNFSSTSPTPTSGAPTVQSVPATGSATSNPSPTGGSSTARLSITPTAVPPGYSSTSLGGARSSSLSLMSDADLMAAAGEASRMSQRGVASADDVGQKIVDEMKKRNIDPSKYM